MDSAAASAVPYKPAPALSFLQSHGASYAIAHVGRGLRSGDAGQDAATLDGAMDDAAPHKPALSFLQSHGASYAIAHVGKGRRAV